MKKTINKLIGFMTLVLMACGGTDEKKEPTDPQAIIDAASEVIGIGKVLPSGGIIELTALEGGQIDRIEVKEGDTVTTGTVIAVLNAKDEQLSAADMQAQQATQRATFQSNKLSLQAAKIKLVELQDIYQRSIKLLEMGAETQEVVNADRTAWQQQEQELAKAQQQLLIDQQLEVEFNQKVKKAELAVQDRTIRAPWTGVVLSLDLRQGQVVQANQAFGEFAAVGEKIIECEVDELYAGKIKQGNSVLVYPVGSNTRIASGEVLSVGIALQNKSILYERIGEGVDRRVKKLIIRISQGDQELLLNDKVECKIIL